MPPSTSLCRPQGLFLQGKGKKKKIGAFISTRGLRHHRYPCVALRAFMEAQPSQPSKPYKPDKPSQPEKPSQPSQPSHYFSL